jgi:hypothetical protein
MQGPDSTDTTVEQAIASKLRDAYDLATREADNAREDYLRRGSLNLIAVLLRQPVAVADRMVDDNAAGPSASPGGSRRSSASDRRR